MKYFKIIWIVRMVSLALILAAVFSDDLYEFLKYVVLSSIVYFSIEAYREYHHSRGRLCFFDAVIIHKKTEGDR